MKTALSFLVLGAAIGVHSFVPAGVVQPKQRHLALAPLRERPEPLAQEGEWTAYLDLDTTGLVYYFNGKTGESLWEPPTSSFPVVVLPRRVRRKAESKRTAYIKTLADLEAKEEFPEAPTARDEEEALQKRQNDKEKKKEQDGEWFDFLFEEEPDPEPTLFDKVFSSKGEDTTSDTTEDKPAEEATTESSDEDGKGGGWGGWIGAVSDPVAEDETVDETPEKEVEKEKRPGLLERLSAVAPSVKDAGPTEDDTTTTTTTTTTEPKEKAPGFFELIRSTAAASTAPVVEEEVVEVAPKPQKATTTLPQPVKEKETKPKEEKIVTPVAEPKPIKIEMSTNVLPHPSKVFWGGEDAVFVTSRTFGVFDGVSGARKLDGVPLYSKTLAGEMRKSVKQLEKENGGEGLSVPELSSILGNAKDIADQTSTGASTAIVASITQDGFLRALNVGDSACLIIRNGKVAARTREISHYFDCPYQFSTDSPDKPRDGTRLNVELVRGDLIVMASDGVFDNLDDSTIVDLITSSLEKNIKLSALAKQISDRSRKVSLNRKSLTPYAKQAKRNGDPDFADGLGGKLDDVSCVVVRYA